MKLMEVKKIGIMTEGDALAVIMFLTSRRWLALIALMLTAALLHPGFHSWPVPVLQP